SSLASVPYLVASVSLHALSSFRCTGTAPTETYTLSLHDALPIFSANPDHAPLAERISAVMAAVCRHADKAGKRVMVAFNITDERSEEHTSELQSRENLVCRLLLEKKKTLKQTFPTSRPQRIFSSV